MIVSRVCGGVNGIKESDGMHKEKMLLVIEVDIASKKEIGEPKIAIDTVGAAEGELVLCALENFSRQTEKICKKSADLAIIGVVDSIDLIGKRIFEKYEGWANEI